LNKSPSVGFIYLQPFKESLGTTQALLNISSVLSQFGIVCHIFTPFEESRKLQNNTYVHKIKGVPLNNLVYKITRNLSQKRILFKVFFSRDGTDILSRPLMRSLQRYIEHKKLKLSLLEGEQEPGCILAAKVAERLGIPSIGVLHNLIPEELADLGMISRLDALYSEARGLVHEAIKSVDVALTITSFMRDYLIKRYKVPAYKLVSLPLFLAKRPNTSVLQTKVKALDQNVLRVIYCGSLAPHENVELFLYAIHEVLKKIEPQRISPLKIQFFISGRGALECELRRLAKSLNTPLKFLWLRSRTEYERFLAHMHIGTITWRPCISRRIGLPMKLLDYLASGLAVISTDVGGWSELIPSWNVGYITSQLLNDFASVMLKLIRDRLTLTQFMKNTLSISGKLYNNKTRLYQIYKKFIDG